MSNTASLLSTMSRIHAVMAAIASATPTTATNASPYLTKIRITLHRWKVALIHRD
jgi:hypothetical protein